MTRIRELDVESLSPLEALTKLFELKRLADESKRVTPDRLSRSASGSYRCSLSTRIVANDDAVQSTEPLALALAPLAHQRAVRARSPARAVAADRVLPAVRQSSSLAQTTQGSSSVNSH